ncbi:MAG: hypothetical protein IJZ89_01835 [Clostridia bacterium]|nr:hypothetical protein [Clostridia bacterium]
MADSEKIDFKQSCENGSLFQLVEVYIKKCCDEKRFPNTAGFCRYCGIGQAEFEELSKDHPREYDALCSVFEDEALNSDVAVTLVGAYMKKRLGYGDEKKIDGRDEPPTVIFKHNIMQDGE